MKKIIVALFFFAFFCFSQNASAQIDVTVSPFGLLLGGDLNVGADFAVQENFSVDVRTGFGNAGRTFGGQGFDINSFPVTVSGKYYLNPKRGADGFSVELFFRNVYRDLTAKAGSERADFTWNRGGFGFGLGYKVVAAKGFTFDIGAGIGRTMYDKISYTNEGEPTDRNAKWIPTAATRLAIGYRFGGSRGER